MELESLARRVGSSRALAFHARVIRKSAEGHSDQELSRRVHSCAATVGRWRNRFASQRVDGLYDEPRPGAPPKIVDATIESIVVKTLESLPEGATHWSTRELARKSGLNATFIRRIWKAFGLQPHQSETFQLSTDDRRSVERAKDIGS